MRYFFVFASSFSMAVEMLKLSYQWKTGNASNRGLGQNQNYLEQP